MVEELITFKDPDWINELNGVLTYLKKWISWAATVEGRALEVGASE
jgi:hypothetical protein